MDQPVSFPLDFPVPPLVPVSEAHKMVQSVILKFHGTLDQIVFEDAPLEKDVPEGHVEVEVSHCGLGMTDNYLRLGIIRHTRFPVVMGSECAGVVRKVGPKVSRIKFGQRVLCLKMQGGLFRRKVHVPQRHCFPIPKDVEFPDAVGLGLNFLMAYVCLFEIGCLKEDQKVLVQSVGGGVGTAVTLLAKTIRGVRVFGTASRFKMEELEELGVDRVFPHTTQGHDDMLEHCTGSMDIVINSNGGSDIDECLTLLRPFGKLVLIGSNNCVIYPKATTGWGFMRPEWEQKVLNTSQLIANNYCVAGVNIGRFIETNPQKVSDILGRIFKLFQRKLIRPVIDNIINIERVHLGFQQLCTRTTFGKVILKIRPESTMPPLAPGSTSSSRLTSSVGSRSSPELELRVTETSGSDAGAASRPAAEDVTRVSSESDDSAVPPTRTVAAFGEAVDDVIDTIDEALAAHQLQEGGRGADSPDPAVQETFPMEL